MFTPIKNFITYIQKNANFGSSNTTSASSSEENNKMEAKNKINSQNSSENIEIGGECLPTKQTNEVHHINGESNKDPTVLTLSSASTSLAKTSPAKSMETITVACDDPDDVVDEYEDDDDDDIESQIESSIMLKKPVKDGSNKNSEILEVKKSPDRSIVIGHDCGRRTMIVASPIDDELADFRHAPSEVIISSPLNNHRDDEGDIQTSANDKNTWKKQIIENSNGHNLSQQEVEMVMVVGGNEKANGHESILISDTSDNEKCNQSAEKIILLDSEFEDVEDRAETLSSVSADEREAEEDDSDETFLDLDNFPVPDSEVIVISENTQENSDMMRIESSDAANTSDDPLAIACDEQEAFAADKMTALKELNLLNTSANSQDEDTTTTADDEMIWLRNETVTTTAAKRNNEQQPSCSSKSPLNILSNGPNSVTPEKDERNGEGSDSGLGSETSALHTTNTSIVDTSHLNMNSSSVVATPVSSPHVQLSKTKDKDISNEVIKTLPTTTTPTKPLRSNLKRRLEMDHDNDVVDSIRNITSAASSTSTSTSSSSLSGNANKKPKRSINFDTVQVYYFPRQQGFSCVPSAGGCTLGMGARHVGFKTLTLAEHAAELRRAHRLQLQEINPRGSSSDDSEESEEDYLSEGSGSDLDGESNGFLQPVSPKQRRTILKAAGVRKIDASEKAECRDIRNSREVCGCSCREFCDPETCACAQSGIKCQVDRDMFPCGCTRDACGNTIGRVEFNPARVRTHFIHTLMRLEMENRQQQNPYTPAGAVISTATVNSSSYYQSHLQPQSNYSSGYASPAYNPGADMHQQNAAQQFYQHHHHQQQQQPTTSGSASLYGSAVGPTSMEISHTVTSSTAASYGMDNMDSSGMFSTAGTSVTPSYGELMPVTSYHPHHNMNYGNVQESQMSGYNSYHNNATPYINTNAQSTNINDNNTPIPTYSSCSIPSLPPYGTATTTECSSSSSTTYHDDGGVSSLTTLDTTTASSSYTKAVVAQTTPTTAPLMDNTNCGTANDVAAAGFVDLTTNDVTAAAGGTSFIDLTTPPASSSRLTQQINDLLENNRNNTTALVAVTQNKGIDYESGSTTNKNDDVVAVVPDLMNGGIGEEVTTTTTSSEPLLPTNNSELSISATPNIEDVNNTQVSANLQTALPPLKPPTIVAATSGTAVDNEEAGPEKLPAPPPSSPPPPVVTEKVEDKKMEDEEQKQESLPLDSMEEEAPKAVDAATENKPEPMIDLTKGSVVSPTNEKEIAADDVIEEMDTTETITATETLGNETRENKDTTERATAAAVEPQAELENENPAVETSTTPSSAADVASSPSTTAREVTVAVGN
ncbi:uncharacterized protein LOC133325089 [Musca vetustissima]|uniref:uncharacterized protein LOC133325089 n=1 Tax=Musca vetustissima TaxID=27455 RepID=UPI002AB60678|nr:uncharacterized protein LOC133325089 [Musca vetustissima]